jgi:hypothetical protein
LSVYGVTNFDVQYWTGAGWAIIPGGSVTGNDKVWRKFTFAPLTTSRIRVAVYNAQLSYSRIVELEAWTATGSATFDESAWDSFLLPEPARGLHDWLAKRP